MGFLKRTIQIFFTMLRDDEEIDRAMLNNIQLRFYQAFSRAREEFLEEVTVDKP